MRALRPLIPLLALIAAAAPSLARADDGFVTCPDRQGTLCGWVTVPLDRDEPGGPSLRLRVEALQAAGGHPRGAVVALAGGPGQAATPYRDDFAIELGPLLEGRDLVVFDQRGTGRDPLRCPAFEKLAPDADPLASATDCTARLGAAGLHYATPDSVADLEAVREALGYDQLVLYGVSYGTKLAEAYAAAHPEHTAAIVLDSPVTLDGIDALALDTVAAVPRVMRALCGHHACLGVTRDVVRAMQATVARMPISGTVATGHGTLHPASMTATQLLSLLVDLDLDPMLRSRVPAALAGAAAGDSAPLLRLYADLHAEPDYDSSPEAISSAVFLATSCSDTSLPWNASDSPAQRLAGVARAVAAAGANAFAPWGVPAVLNLGSAAMCLPWPNAGGRNPLPPAPPAAPTLVLSGRHDLRTPLENARQIAATFPSAQVVTVPGVGHDVLGATESDCGQRALARFDAGKPVGDACAREPELPISARSVARLASLRPLPGTRGSRGRVAAAAKRTVVQLLPRVNVALFASDLDAESLSGAGLRGGWFTFGEAGLTLHHVREIPGVVVEGNVDVGMRGAIVRISGVVRVHARHASGRLVLHRDGRVTGRLGGRPISSRRQELIASGASSAVRFAAKHRPAIAKPTVRP